MYMHHPGRPTGLFGMFRLERHRKSFDYIGHVRFGQSGSTCDGERRRAPVAACVCVHCYNKRVAVVGGIGACLH